jgi:DNA-binding transcriptional ArsR family regulator
MASFVHPSKDDITLTGVLAALSDPVRLRILQSMMEEKSCMSCSKASPCPSIAKSTISHHFRILREAGLVRTVKKGVEHQNTVRLADINERFPGLLKTILKLADDQQAA